MGERGRNGRDLVVEDLPRLDIWSFGGHAEKAYATRRYIRRSRAHQSTIKPIAWHLLFCTSYYARFIPSQLKPGPAHFEPFKNGDGPSHASGLPQPPRLTNAVNPPSVGP
jgi:hypothetical protein